MRSGTGRSRAPARGGLAPVPIGRGDNWHKRQRPSGATHLLWEEEPTRASRNSAASCNPSAPVSLSPRAFKACPLMFATHKVWCAASKRKSRRETSQRGLTPSAWRPGCAAKRRWTAIAFCVPLATYSVLPSSPKQSALGDAPKRSAGSRFVQMVSDDSIGPCVNDADVVRGRHWRKRHIAYPARRPAPKNEAGQQSRFLLLPRPKPLSVHGRGTEPSLAMNVTGSLSLQVPRRPAGDFAGLGRRPPSCSHKPAPATLHSSALAVSPDKRYVVCANAASDDVSVIDTRTDTVVENHLNERDPADLFGASPNALCFWRRRQNTVRRQWHTKTRSPSSPFRRAAGPPS